MARVETYSWGQECDGCGSYIFVWGMDITEEEHDGVLLCEDCCSRRGIEIEELELLDE